MVAVLLIFCVISKVFSEELSLDNAIKGSPIVKCDEHLVRVYFETKKPFQGHVFVRGHYSDDDCHRDYLQNKNNYGSMTVPFSKCGMRRARTANPKGMMMTATIMTSFHRTFVTAMDKAFQIQCFYVEGDQVVTQNLAISDIPTVTLHTAPPMPACRYEVLLPDGAPAHYAKVGDTLQHKWTCKDDFLQAMYCMSIVNCFVDDGATNSFELIDDFGCSKDYSLLDDLTYTSDLTASVPSLGFRFADKPNLFFSCRVKLDLKHEQPNEICPRPKCGAPSTLLHQNSRSKRSRSSRSRIYGRKNKSAPIQSPIIGDFFDVNAPQLLILDLDDESPQKVIGDEAKNDVNSLPATTNFRKQRTISFLDRFFGSNDRIATSAVCLSTSTFAVLSSIIIFSLIILIAICMVLLYKKLVGKRY